MKEQEDIDHLFKSAFDDFAVAPPASVRESVNLAIAAKRKKKFVRWFFAGVVAFVLLFVTAISMLDNAQRDSQLAQNNTDNSNNNSTSHHSSGNNISATSNHEQNQNDGTNAAVSTDTIKSSVQGSEKILNSKSKKEKGSTPSRSRSTSKKIKSGTQNVTSNSKSSKTSQSKYLKDNRVKTGKPRVPKISAGKISSKGKNAKNPKSSKNNAGNTNGNSSGALAGNSGSSEGNKVLSENSDNGNKSGNGSTNIETSKETKAPEKKEDPIAKVDSTQTPYADSSPLDEEPEKPKKKQDHPLLLSLRGGTTFGFNQLKTADTANTLKEKGSFFFQGEATYFLKPRIAITSGFNYEGRTENLSQEVTTMDSVVVGSHMEYIFDSLQILDSFLVDDYGVQSVTSNRQNSYKLYAVSLPVLFTYSQPLSSKFNLDVSAGAILSLQGSKVISETYNQGLTVVNKFGVRACVRTQLRYQFSAWGVSLNTNFGYDLVPVNTWNGVKRTRTFLDLGVGVHYLIGK